MSTDMLEFIDELTAWHVKKVSNLRAVQEGVKEGTVLKIGEDDEDGTVMTYRDAAYFKCGLEAALVELGKLPFTVIHDEASSDAAERSGA